MKPFLLFCLYINIFCGLILYHMTQICWPKFNSKGHGITSITEIWMNRLNPKFWELDIWTNHLGLFDSFHFSCCSMGVLIGTATFARQIHMASEWTNPIDLLKGHLRPYRGVKAALEDIWNTKESCFIFWLIPTYAYSSFKIDRLAPEKTIFKQSSLQGGKSSGHDHAKHE
jgi:hypothetical protein